jgi:hypothetical protein
MKNKVKTFAKFGFCIFALLFSFSFVAQTGAQVSLPKKNISEKPKLGRQIPEGYSLIDGDIMMPTWFVESVLRRSDGQRLSAPQATYRTNLWTDGIVWFEFENQCQPTSTCANAPASGCVSAANQTNMTNAMAVLENVANLDFRQCPNNFCDGVTNHIRIRDSTNDTTANTDNTCNNNPRNSSQVGMVGFEFAREQTLNIVSWGSQFIIVHELLHALGFYHEQIRPDRNNFVTINCSNVQGGCSGTLFNNNFVTPSDARAYGAYDFDSLMHYGQCDFSIDCPPGSSCNCTNTVITVLAPNQSWQTLIGQRTHLSELDRAMVSFLYPQPNWRFLDCSYNLSNGVSNGTIHRPYTTLNDALANTPSGGTLWISGPCPPFPTGTYLPSPFNNNQITIRAAPNIIATFGN